MENKENKENKETVETIEEINEEVIEPAEKKEEKEMKVSSANKRAKKAERREAKAARKAANMKEEKKTRPNNVIIAILIFGMLIIMVGAVKGYEYFSKDASIEAYLEENAESYTGMMLDENTTANFTAEDNSLTITIDTTQEDDAADELKEYYGTEDGEDYLKYLGSYFLTSIKESVRGFSSDVTVVLNLNGDELKTVTMTYKEAKDYLEELEEEASEDAEAEDTEETEESTDEEAETADTSEADE